jgi:hypothetical protein
VELHVSRHVDLEDRQVVLGVGADHLALVLAAVGEVDQHLVRFFHDVVVGQDVAPGVDDGAGARPALLGNRLQEPVDGHRFGGDVHHGVVETLIDGNILLLVVVKDERSDTLMTRR